MNDLTIQLAEARAAVAALEREIAAETRCRLEEEHKELVTQCRTAKAEMIRLREEANRWRDESIRRAGEMENSSRHLTDWSETRPRDCDYPSEQELAIWRAELEKRQTAASQAEKASAGANREYQTARGAWLRAKEAYEKLSERESMLRSQLQPQRGSGITMTILDGASDSTRIVRA